MRREAFSSLLQGVYLLYEPPMHRQAAVRDARIAIDTLAQRVQLTAAD